MILTYLMYAGAIIALAFVVRRRMKYPLPLPPGPAAEPPVGHLRVFSAEKQHELFRKWAAEYGDIFHLNILGQTLVVLNSVRVATDLLDKRGSNYSDRPSCTKSKVMGWEAVVASMQYGPRWRKHRKMLQEYFGHDTCATYIENQTREAHHLLKALLTESQHFLTFTRSFALESLIRITYGHQVDSKDDTYVKLAEDAMLGLEVVMAGMSLLDLFPSLRHIPDWFPVLSSLTAGPRRWRPATRRLFEYPFQDVCSQTGAGVSQPSFLASHIRNIDMARVSSDDLEDIKGVAAITLAAGAESTWSLIQTFFLAMVLFPVAQCKAQEEIDRVCVMQETMRWHPVGLLGIAHKSRDDDMYDGMFIPKDSIMIPNVMAMSRDERAYKDAERFEPERFLPTPAGRGEPHLSCLFGFGRRICPGRYFADNSVWLVVANALTTFTISKCIGADGSVIEPRVEFTTEGQISRPKPFECVIEPRSAAVKALVLHQYD